ncbi:hypothetical protein ACL9RL_16115 [Plantibacter sp. Mn2098]|uniref:hypothetical protein n=1 Tax=Plantibacter sp. Mn2098 TaxID=3395266 RepID=UPI003BC3A231
MSERTAALDDTISTFAAAVRRHLDDLSAEDVDDLTGGLEADLSEQASDDGGRLDPGDPKAYADELRASAGFAARSDARPSFRAGLRSGIESFASTFGRSIRSTRLGSWLLDSALALRPVWWVFRGWAVYQVVAFVVLGRSSLLPTDPLLWALLIASLTLSVQWGRGQWVPNAFLGGLRTTVSVVTILITPFLLGWTVSATTPPRLDDTVLYTDPNGLRLDGERVQNIFGYDADGNPISDLQLFDQDGKPLVTVGKLFIGDDIDEPTSSGTITVPFDLGSRGRAWNIFPLAQTERNATGDIADAAPATPPFPTTYPVQRAATPVPTPVPTPPVNPTQAPSAE